MAAVDGSIIIDTRIDQKGFNKGTQNMARALGNVLNVVKSIGKVLFTAFVGGSIFAFFRSLVGSVDLLKSSVADKFKPLSDALATLKGAFINLLVTAIIPMLPYIIQVVQWFTNLLFTVTKVIAALFGMKKTIGGITTETKKATKETKGALAAFDQINILQKQQADEGEAGTPATPPPLTVPQELLDKVEALKKKIIEFLTPAIELFLKLKQIVIEVFEKISTWVKENPEKVKLFLLVLGLLVLAFLAVLAAIWLITTAMTVWSAVTTVAAAVGGFFAAVMWLITTPVGLVILAILLLVAAVILFAFWLRELAELAPEIWEAIKAVWILADIWFRQHVTDPLKKTFNEALDAIKEKFGSVFTWLEDFVRGVIDSILGYFNTMIGSLLAGIAMISGLSAGNMSAGVGGQASFQIPQLASGAVIPPNARFAAILGDQRSGTNIEAPADLIRQIVREEMQALSGDVTVTMPVYLDGEVVYRNQKRINTRHGRNLISGQ